MRGHWVYEEDRRNHWHCSECGHTVGQLGHTYNFCPICGADMREEDIEQPKIIHCKDCLYNTGEVNEKGHTVCLADGSEITDYDYCSRAMEKIRFLNVNCPIITCGGCECWDTSWETSAGAQYHYCSMMDTITKDDEYCSRSELADNIDLHIPTEIIDSVLGEDE